MTARWSVGLITGALFGLLIFLNLRYASRGGIYLPPNVIPFPYTRWVQPRGILLIALAVSAFFGVTAGSSAAGDWLSVLAFLQQVAFGVSDPLFNLDIGFFVFTLPIWSLLQQILAGAVVLSLLLVGGFYAFTGKMTFTGGGWPTIHPQARGHLFALLAAFLFLKAGGYLIDAYRLVYSTRGVAFGASYTDVHVQLPALRILALLAVGVGLLALVNIYSRQHRLLIGGVGLLLAVSLVLGGVLPVAVQKIVVEPNEIRKESPYIKHNIRYTQWAYGLNRIQEREFPAAENLTAADLSQQQGTLENIRLWDMGVLQSLLHQLQAIRQYYRFNDIDVDRYRVNGRIRQVVLTPREIDYTTLPERTWINQHLKYTHGYGVVLAPAAEITREGQPPLWIKNIPPTSATDLKVERPEIYFGELTNTYAIVKTTEPEFDYPQGDQNQYTLYDGRGGIPIGSIWNRLAFALYTNDYNVLFSRAITGDSRVLMVRNIQDRVSRIAPFLLYDSDPYLVISQGRLYWIQDAYTVTSRYPYSKTARLASGQRFNYIRNSVKVVIDAYHGDTTFYVADQEDPLVRTFQRVFPTLFRPIEGMDPDLRAHVRYPELLFTHQMEMYATYHMQDPDVFYNKEDLWSRPLESDGVTRPPYYVIMQLPDAPEPEFLLMTPFTPSTKKNMIAWVAARSDGDQYGELIVYKLPKQRNIFGPQQVEGLITNNDLVAEKKTLWSQQGSQVLWGNLLVIPVRDALLYVQPLYLQSATTKLPELRRVIVFYNSRVVMEETLEEALAKLFDASASTAAGGGDDDGQSRTQDQTGQPPTSGAAPAGAMTDAELIRQANRLYDEAQSALRVGDLATFGDRINRLGEVLGRLRPTQ